MRSSTAALRDADSVLSAGLVGVLPLYPRDKVPISTLAPRGAYSASNDLRSILEWQALWPDCNWGGVTGDSWLVVDFDLDVAGAAETVAALEARFGAFPPTARVLTSRGCHLYYRVPVGARVHPSKLGPGIEVRTGYGMYNVIPTSVHPSGRRYEWDRPLRFATFAPDWLLRLDVLTHCQDQVPAPGTTASLPNQPQRTAMGEALRAAFSDWRVVLHVAPMVGIDADRLSRTRKVRCPLGGPGHDQHPSAAVIHGENGVFGVYSFHDCRRDDRRFWLFAEIYAGRSFGVMRSLSPHQLAASSVRLLVDSGLATRPIDSPLLLPSAVESGLRATAQAIEDSYAVGRWLGCADAGVPLVPEYLGAITGATPRQARYDLAKLVDAGLIAATGRDARCQLWTPTREMGRNTILCANEYLRRAGQVVGRPVTRRAA